MTNQTIQALSVFNASGRREISTFEATLFDDDLIRGDDAGERVETSSGTPIFNGYTIFGFDGPNSFSGEVETSVTFSDGSVLDGVLGLRDLFIGYASSTSLYLLDQSALAAAGKTQADIVDIQVTANVDHDLSWADLGFGGSAPLPDPQPDPQPEPDPMPEPEPVPVVTLIEGTDGRDRLVGTSADEIFVGGDDNDRLTGNGGADTFVFGADARDGGRDRDVITDFGADDTLVLEQGASIWRVFERNGDTYVQLNGDRDMIVLRDTDASVVDSFVLIDDSYL